MRFILASFMVLCVGLTTSTYSFAERGETPSVNSKIQKLKKRAENLHKELAVLEQELLYPASSQLAVYVSMQANSFDMDSIELEINGKRASNYLYSDEQVVAFNQGGIQQLYIDNVGPGYVDISIKINGKQQGKRSYHKQVKQRFHKNDMALALELVIEQAANAQELTTKLVLR